MTVAKKPIGQYEIDWSHPLSKRLRLCVLGENPVNIVNNIRYDTGSTVKVVATPYGLANRFDNTVDSVLVSTEDNAIPQIAEQDHTILSFANPQNEANRGSLYRQAEIGGGLAQVNLFVNVDNYTLGPGTYAGRLVYGTHDNSGNNAGCYVDGHIDGNFHKYVGKREGTLYSLFVDGKLAVSNTGSGYQIGHHVTTIGSYYYDSGTIFDDDIIITLVWDRALTDTEIATISNDVFQFLKPVKTIPSIYALTRPCPDINLVTPPTKGDLSLNADGSFSYVYTAGNQPDTDFFEYSITSYLGTGNIARVDLTINTAPPNSKDDEFDVAYNITFNGSVLDDNGYGIDTYSCGDA